MANHGLSTTEQSGLGTTFVWRTGVNNPSAHGIYTERKKNNRKNVFFVTLISLFLLLLLAGFVGVAIFLVEFYTSASDAKSGLVHQ